MKYIYLFCHGQGEKILLESIFQQIKYLNDNEIEKFMIKTIVPLYECSNIDIKNYKKIINDNFIPEIKQLSNNYKPDEDEIYILLYIDVGEGKNFTLEEKSFMNDSLPIKSEFIKLIQKELCIDNFVIESILLLYNIKGIENALGLPYPSKNKVNQIRSYKSKFIEVIMSKDELIMLINSLDRSKSNIYKLVDLIKILF